MVFFRIKKIKGKEYIYLVENEWIKGKARQKVKKYLGRGHKPELKNKISFLEYKNIALEECLKKTLSEIMYDLISWESFRHGISNEFLLSLTPASLTKDGKNVVLMINEGFMCSLTLKNLLEFKPINHENDTFRLARAFVEAGILVPQEIFVGICEKLFKFEE